jgi:hypothetical protein
MRPGPVPFLVSGFNSVKPDAIKRGRGGGTGCGGSANLIFEIYFLNVELNKASLVIDIQAEIQ